MAVTSLAVFGVSRSGQPTIDDKAESVGTEFPVTAMGGWRRRRIGGALIQGFLLMLGLSQ